MTAKSLGLSHMSVQRFWMPNSTINWMKKERHGRSFFLFKDFRTIGLWALKAKEGINVEI